MNFDISAFLQKKFDEGCRLHNDILYKQKRELLSQHNVPFEETETPNIVKVKMGTIHVLVHLLTAEEDKEEKFVRIKTHGTADWKEIDINFFVSKYKSSLSDLENDVLIWLKSHNIPYEEINDYKVKVVVPINSKKLYLSRSSDKQGRIPVRFSMESQDYHYNKDTLLDEIRGIKSSPIYRTNKRPSFA